jgi:thymidylate synthase (FAD)
MDCWRQWIRHRTANINEYSTRYSVAVDATQTTKPDEWRLQAVTNRQGSEGILDEKKGGALSKQETELQDLTRKIYNEKLELGIAREQARKDLLLSTYTEAYWKIDLHNLFHFLALRMEENAQYEIRCYANTIGREIVSRWCPIAWEAFQDYRINSMVFSKQELEIIKAIGSGNLAQATEVAKSFEWINVKDGKLKGNLERAELEEKLELLGLHIPWQDLK